MTLRANQLRTWRPARARRQWRARIPGQLLVASDILDRASTPSTRSRSDLAGLGEDSTLEPTNPYSAAKAGAEMMARAYLTSYRLPVITTRGNNVYGPHQFPEKMIPKFTLLASRGQDLPIHGDGAVPLYQRSYYHSTLPTPWSAPSSAKGDVSLKCCAAGPLVRTRQCTAMVRCLCANIATL